MAHAPTQARAPTFFDEVVAATPGESNLERCIQCGTCTNVCPVVANYQESPQDMGFLDITPQQIVNSFRLGMTARVLNSKMAWDCFTCFKCQEHCPRAIPIAEMIYELRNRGYRETSS